MILEDVRLNAVIFEQKDGKKLYGFTIKDNYSYVFYDGMTKNQFDLENLVFFKYIYDEVNDLGDDSNESLHEIFQCALDNGIYINGEYFDDIELNKIIK